jgi:hypothetical protein
MARVLTNVLKDLALEPIPLIQLDKQALSDAVLYELEVHNELLADATSLFMEQTTLELESIASQRSGMKLVRGDEIGTPVTVGGSSTPARVGYPLEGYFGSVGWTSAFWRTANTIDLTNRLAEVELADVTMLRGLIAQAIYSNATTTNYQSAWMRNNTATPIDLRRFWNNDGSVLPTSWKGTTFPTTHTHYLAANGVTAAALATLTDSLIDTVEEHTEGNQTILVVSNSDVSKVKAMPGFIELLPARVIESVSVRRTDLSLDITQTDDRLIGLYNGRDVYVKPWAIAGYFVCLNVGANKPLKQRNPIGFPVGLHLEEENTMFRLQARTYGHITGIGTYNRSGGAVLDLVNPAYTAPVITV